MEKRSILITGGVGFIGSHLTASLSDDGEEVSLFDCALETAHDVRDPAALARALRGVTHVVHLAALTSVPQSIQNSSSTYDVNITGTLNVLEAARKAGVQRVVYASSAAVYGDEPSLPKREDSPLVPQSPYAKSKVENERAAARFSAGGLPTLGLRFFNVYGKGQKGNHPYASVIPRWTDAFKKGESLTLYGDGEQTRDFVHVSDVARALRRALDTDATGILNIASGQETSLNELHRFFESALGRGIPLERRPARPGDIKRSVADISRAAELLGWSPRVSLLEGIRELLTNDDAGNKNGPTTMSGRDFFENPREV